MNEQLGQLSARAITLFKKTTDLTAKHRFLTVFSIASASVLAALLQSGAYLNPTRNEARYEEETLKINYSTINQDTVEKLSSTQEDKDIQVDSKLVPNRNNPFTE